MPVTLDEFVTSLSDSGLLPAGEIRSLLADFSASGSTVDTEAFAGELVRRKKLTKLQAAAAYQGKVRNLIYGDYVVLEKIAEGGMGEIFRAMHRRMERVVALKLLPDEIVQQADDRKIARFQREVKAAARLEHPNIITAFDAGEAHGHHYLVMQYVDGSDLRTCVKNSGPLAVENAVDYIYQAAHGLEYAHNQGVIHRDIKPANLVLDRKGVVRILDMGLARFEEAVAPSADEEGKGNKLTQPGQIMGTVEYMSPEQASDTHDADARSDIYSLGCTLYYLLVGEPPYTGETLAHMLFLNSPTSIPSIRASRPDVPESVDALFQRMVAHDAARRYSTMTHVLAALEATGLVEPASPSRARYVRLTSHSSEEPGADGQEPGTRPPVPSNPAAQTSRPVSSDSKTRIDRDGDSHDSAISSITDETIAYEAGSSTDPRILLRRQHAAGSARLPLARLLAAVITLAALLALVWWLVM